MKTLVKISGFIIILILILQVLQGCKKSENDLDDPQPIGSEDMPLPYEYTEWMSNLDDHTPLSKLTIPGTHDTGADLHTSQQGTESGIVIAQHYRLSNQLKLGVRWFDIRLRLNDGALTVHHGPYYLHKNFDDMLQPALDFLVEHPRETVIFMIKQEDSKKSDHDFAQAVYNKLTAHSADLSKFYMAYGFPILGHARGKIVIVRRFTNDLGHEFGTYMKWDDNTKGDWFGDDIRYYVQDHYSLLTVDNAVKIYEIKDCIHTAEYHDLSKQDVFLNFTSGERDVENLAKIASVINPFIDTYLKSYGYTRCGVIMVNFAGGSDWDPNGKKDGKRYCIPNFVKHIIERNPNPYETVQIGTQTWMKRNLDVDHYKNGDKIPQVADPSDFGYATTGCWVYYDNNNFFEGHQKLYNWYAITDPRGLAPKGYHIATDAEWATLENYCGGSDIAANKLKETGYDGGWHADGGATNESGFSAHANGVVYMGSFQLEGYRGLWWMAAETGGNTAIFRQMDYDKTSVTRYEDDWVSYGASVRCIKD